MDLDLARRFIEHEIDKRTTAGSGPIHQAHQAGTIISVVVVAVVALVGILIFAEIDAAVPEPSNPELANASTSIGTGFANAIDLVPIVLLVSVAALVIGVVQRLRSGGGMR